MRVCVLIPFLLLFSPPIVAAENFSLGDYIGTWKTTFPVTNGERTSLSIHADYSSTLVREFPESNKQVFDSSTDQFSTHQDLIVIEFRTPDRNNSYKLVLSGWRSGETKYIFGALYMYRDGKLFNGLPITFTNDTPET